MARTAAQNLGVITPGSPAFPDGFLGPECGQADTEKRNQTSMIKCCPGGASVAGVLGALINDGVLVIFSGDPW
jgi:hypothetical protein